MLTPPFEDAILEESDDSFFFRYLGGVQFSSRDQPLEAPGGARLVASAQSYGITVFSDLNGKRGPRTLPLRSTAAGQHARDAAQASAS